MISSRVRVVHWFAPVIALVALALFAGHVVKADDAATSQPSAATGSITVTVLDPDGNPAAKVALQLFPQAPAADDSADAKPKKPKALAKGRTDADGKFTFPNLASGDYRVTAALKKSGTKGSGTASVTDAAPSATLTINLAGAATTAPAAQ
jgi:5-hydroxyisourate hydrolase-like protein (transthyretin family)